MEGSWNLHNAPGHALPNDAMGGERMGEGRLGILVAPQVDG
jgi:hypothetical protein